MTSGRLVQCCPRALWQEPSCRETLPHHVRQVELVTREAHRFEVIHWHLDYVHFPVVDRLPCPTVTTLHGRMHAPDHQALLDAYPRVPLVSISNDQRRPLRNVNWVRTVYHGLPRDSQTFRETPGKYLAFLGRLSPEKGVDTAVEITRRAGMPLKVAAKIYTEEALYYEEVIEPLFRVSPWVDFVGEVGGRAKDEFLGNAHAALFPIKWAEPFGLVMTEAMACGTPVVAFRRGSVPEVMTDGVTGFVVDDVPEAVDAVGRVGRLSRQACRRSFEDRFDAAWMAQDYLSVYRKLEVDWPNVVVPPRGRALAERPPRPSASPTWRPNSTGKRTNYGSGSSKFSGATTSALTPWPWTVRSGNVESDRRTSASACSPVSQFLIGPLKWPVG